MIPANLADEVQIMPTYDLLIILHRANVPRDDAEIIFAELERRAQK